MTVIACNVSESHSGNNGSLCVEPWHGVPQFVILWKMQPNAAKFTEIHEYQAFATVDRKPLKIPHNLENGSIILYPSPLFTPSRGSRFKCPIWLFRIISARQPRSLARRVSQAMAGALVKRRNAASGLGWLALRESTASGAAALRSWQIQPVFTAERALLRRLL